MKMRVFLITTIFLIMVIFAPVAEASPLLIAQSGEGGGSYAFDKNEEEAAGAYDFDFPAPETGYSPTDTLDYFQRPMEYYLNPSVIEYLYTLNDYPNDTETLEKLIQEILNAGFHGLAQNLIAGAKLNAEIPAFFDKYLGLIQEQHYFEPAKAIPFYESYLAKFPLDNYIRYRMAKCMEESGEDIKALIEYSFIIENTSVADSTFESVAIMLADKYNEEENSTALLFLIEMVLGKELGTPLRENFVLRAAEIYFPRKQLAEAEALFMPVILNYSNLQGLDDILNRIAEYYQYYGYGAEHLDFMSRVISQARMADLVLADPDAVDYDYENETTLYQTPVDPILLKKYLADAYTAMGEYALAIPLYINIHTRDRDIENPFLKGFFASTRAMLVFAYYKSNQINMISPDFLTSISSKDMGAYGYYYHGVRIQHLIHQNEHLLALKYAAGVEEEFIYASLYLSAFAEKFGLSQLYISDFRKASDEYYTLFAGLYEYFGLTTEAQEVLNRRSEQE